MNGRFDKDDPTATKPGILSADKKARLSGYNGTEIQAAYWEKGAGAAIGLVDERMLVVVVSSEIKKAAYYIK